MNDDDNCVDKIHKEKVLYGNSIDYILIIVTPVMFFVLHYI